MPIIMFQCYVNEHKSKSASYHRDNQFENQFCLTHDHCAAAVALLIKLRYLFI